MRTLQIVIFIAGLLSFIVAVASIGQELGDILWRLGIALMLTDLVLLKLWPGRGNP